ncbi:MAG: hypothetical protein AB7I30_13035 [Isosphaeraceae bacterium]
MRRVSFGVGIAVVYSFVMSGGMVQGAAPAPPSYQSVTRVIQEIREDWAKPGATPQPNAPGWNSLFGTLEQDLKAYSEATSEDDRLRALNRVYQISVALGTVGWSPALRLREALRDWLRPRVRIAWASRRLSDRVRSLPSPASPDVELNREKWLTFVKGDLGEALRAYDGANTVARRAEALDAVHKALDALNQRNRSYAWNPSLELQAALNDLFELPNLDLSIDVSTLAPFFNQNLVTSGPVYRKGYVSQVTAGPKTGFGLLFNDDGIAFYNSQLLSSHTPIWDFQQQIASDPEGQRAARMYHFNMATTDQQELTIVAVIRASGLALHPSFKHNVGMLLGASPMPGGGLMRFFASLLGYSRERILQEVRANAFPRIRENVIQEALLQALENTSAESAQRNATLRQYLIGDNRLVYQNVLVEGLSLRSRPENALISGRVQFLGAEGQRGADAPQPQHLATPDYGVSADLHLTSLLTNFVAGYLHSPEVQRVQTLLIETRNVPAGSPAGAGLTITRNADFPTFLKAIDDSKAANDPKVQALRVKRPSEAPAFGVDDKGNLVAIVKDFQVEVPAPSQTGRVALPGPPAKLYRITSPAAEVSVSFEVRPSVPGGPLEFKGKVENVDLGPNGKVFAINDDEAKAQALNRLFANVVIGLVRVRIQGQSIDLPLSNLPLQGFALRKVSPLDPSGWVRATLVRTGQVPLATLAGP